MSVNSATSATTVYTPPQDSQVGQTTANLLTPAMLEVVRNFGLVGDAELRDALVNSPIGSMDVGSLLSAADRLDSMSQSMADVYSVMLLLSKMSQEQRESSRAIRDAEQQSQLTSMQEGADKIREAADFALAAGIVSGVVKMASGGLAVGGGIKGMKDLKSLDASMTPDVPTTPKTNTNNTQGGWVNGVSPSKQGTAATNPTPTGSQQMTNADLRLEQIKAQGRVFDGTGQIVSGTGDVIAAGLTRAGEEARAEEKELDAEAKSHEMAAEKESDFMSINREMITKIADMLREIARLNSESEKAAATI